MLVSKEQLFFVQHLFLPTSHFAVILQNRKCWDTNRKPFSDFILFIQTPRRCRSSSREAQNSCLPQQNLHEWSGQGGKGCCAARTDSISRGTELLKPRLRSGHVSCQTQSRELTQQRHFFPSIPHPSSTSQAEALPRFKEETRALPTYCKYAACSAVPPPRRWERTDRGQAQHSLGRNKKG